MRAFVRVNGKGGSGLTDLTGGQESAWFSKGAPEPCVYQPVSTQQKVIMAHNGTHGEEYYTSTY